MLSSDKRYKVILIVEDEYALREALREALELEDYTVYTAENGKIALERLKVIDTPCLILLDMMMPIMGGREFLDAAQKDSALAAIPVLVVSSAADEKNTVGSKGFFKKPVDLDLLLKMVAQYSG